MIETIFPAYPSRMKELALEEKEREISKEIKDIVTLQTKVIKEAMKKNKNYCFWIPFEKINVNFDLIRVYSVEAEIEVRRVFEDSGYKVTKDKIEWEV